MKKIFIVLASVLFSMQGFSQAALPTSYNFDDFAGATTLPSGWSTNITGEFFYVVGQSGIAGKLDAQDEFIQYQT